MDAVRRPAKRPPAPRLDVGPWVNTDRPLTHADLVGRVVLVQLWRASQVRSIEALAHLDDLVARAPDSVLALGTHVPSTERGRNLRHLEAALVRHAVRPPVVQDLDGALPEALGIEQVPSRVLLDAEARIAARFGPTASSTEVLDALETLADETGEPAPQLDIRGRAPRPTTLLAPQGLSADAGGERVALADTGHHRVLVLGPQGERQVTIGAGRPGLVDGPSRGAEFRAPRGVHLDGSTLFVADTGNHAVRRIDLEAGRVETVAGTGERARGSPGAGPARDQRLASPWGIAPLPRPRGEASRLVVALAGQDALVALDPDSGTLAPWAGTGAAEAFPELPLSEPRGLATDGDRLYVAETAAGRVLGLDPGTQGVEVLAGADGTPLAHPTDVAVEATTGRVLVAEAYRDRVLALGPGPGACEVLVAGKRLEGTEPRAVASSGADVLVCATDGHQLLARGARGEVARRTVPELWEGSGDGERLDPVELTPGGRLRLRIVGGRGGPEAIDRAPSVSGPVRPVETTVSTDDAGTRVAHLVGRAEASGLVEITWSNPKDAARTRSEARWWLPVVLRPGGPREIELQLATPR